MRERKNDSVRALAAEAGLSLSQIAKAKAEGVDCKNPAALAAYRARTNTRSDGKAAQHPDQPEIPVEMTLEEMEAALRSKHLSTNDARTLQIQIAGLKGAIALRQQMNQLLSRAECCENQAKTAHALGGFIRALETELPSLCYGKSMGEAKALVRDKVRELQGILADCQSEFWKDHPEG